MTLLGLVIGALLGGTVGYAAAYDDSPWLGAAVGALAGLALMGVVLAAAA